MTGKLKKFCAKIPGLKKLTTPKPVIPVLRLEGAIGNMGGMRPGLTIASCAKLMEQAFENDKAPAVAVIINSPGGLPVQSVLIHQRLRFLATQKKKKLLVFVEDVAASGGYMIACAGDEIFAQHASIVGSIGVISSGFGFTGLIDKIGVERRVYTAGKSKSQLDSFLPEDPEKIARFKELQQDLHGHFIELVKECRGDRLGESPDDDLFSGAFWTGAQAEKLGLIDGIGEIRQIIEQRYGDKARLEMIEAKKTFPWSSSPVGVHMKAGISADLGTLADNLPKAALATLEERDLWARFGL